MTADRVGTSRMRFSMITVAGLAMAGTLVVSMPQAAVAAPNVRNRIIDAPAGAVAVRPGHAMKAGRVRLPDGRTATVTVEASPPHSVNVQASPSSLASPAYYSCWKVYGNVTYSIAGATGFSFHDDVGWCGNGSTMSNPTHQIYGIVNAAGIADQWVYQGVISGPTDTQYYQGYAYQTFVQGKFEQCFFHYGCDGIVRTPIIWWNLYATGGNAFYWRG